jgi:hypothetical protein
MFDNLPSNEAVYSAGSITKSQSNGRNNSEPALQGCIEVTGNSRKNSRLEQK